MSRRSRRRRDARGRDRGGRESRRRESGGRDSRAGVPGERESPGRASRGQASDPLSRLSVQLVVLAAIFVLAVVVAELAGAANLGVSLGVGQIAFAIALVYLLLRR